VLQELLAIGIIWFTGGFTLYWNLAGKKILPSNEHVRVAAVIWPIAVVGLAGWGILKMLGLTAGEVKKTVVAFHTVADWRYHEGRILPAPKTPTKDSFDLAAEAEIHKLVPDLGDD
jgi:hypothetical protein